MGCSKKTFYKKTKEWNNSGDGVLSLVLNSFFASSGSVLKRVLIKNSSNGVLSKKRL